MKAQLSLQAQPGAWRMYSARKANAAFGAFQKKILHRDRYTCQFCGFQARQYQDLVNLDGNYRNNKARNIVTACCFCTQCFFLESVGVGDFGGGTLIYLPEISQEQLNSFCHVIFCAITNDTGYKASAQSIYRSFKFRSQLVEDALGEGSSSPSTVGQLLIDSAKTDIKEQQKLLDGVRLLPSRAKFRQQIERWAATALDELSSDE